MRWVYHKLSHKTLSQKTFGVDREDRKQSMKDGVIYGILVMCFEKHKNEKISLRLTMVTRGVFVFLFFAATSAYAKKTNNLFTKKHLI